jgi:Domain of unknown function (DUF6456)
MEKLDKPVAPSSDYTALFNFLALSPTMKLESGGESLVLTHNDKSMRLSTGRLALLVTKGLIMRKNHTITLTDAGRNCLPFNHANRNLRITHLGKDFIVENKDESPLSALAHRKMVDGTLFLQPDEFEAGERIRSDFTRGMMMPRITASWQASVSSGSHGERNGAEDFTHSALAARNRLDAALQCLGRDLAGVVTDICCYLKGFEQVEMERKWPKRSAKFMLKAALSILVLHYNPPAHTKARSHKWGAEDYRPKIT